jgi:hypothetical protein
MMVDEIVRVVRDKHQKEDIQEDPRRPGMSPFFHETGYQPKKWCGGGGVVNSYLFSTFLYFFCTLMSLFVSKLHHQ